MLLVTWAVVAGTVYDSEGAPGIIAATLAATVCLGAGIAALLITQRFANTRDAVSGVLGGTLVRTGIPMAAAVLISNNSPTLASAGVFGKFVIFFLVTLAAETWLSVSLVNASPSRRNRTTAGGSLHSAGTP